ncbi:MAG TPA: hypothetical protein VGF45_01335, partial [Polyangia bacterium]
MWILDAVLVCPTALAFSGVVPSAREDHSRCNAGMGIPFRFLGDLGKAEKIGSGTCTRGLRICNAEHLMLTNLASSPRV